MSDRKRPDDHTQQIASFGTSPIVTPPLKETGLMGKLFKDRYMIEGELGRGGIGVVYLARDTQLLGRRVVIKVLLEDQETALNNPWFRKKFEQEIEALVRIDHPGVVGLLDAGTMADGKPFLVMQFVEGVSLRTVMEEQQLDFPRVARIMRQLGQALSAAHDKGIVHRDLKPDNIMVQAAGEGEEIVKLIDFGIATVRDSQAAAGAEKTKVAGALPYMAPEQLRGLPAPSSDIWAMGVTAYEMLTGHLPFYSETLVQLYELQRSGPGARPRRLRPELPDAAEAAILKALEYEAGNRFAQARDFGEELARALTTDDKVFQTSGQFKPVDPTTSLAPEVAHVLFMDLVGYSKLPMDDQARLQRELREIVRGTNEYQKAYANNQMISLPTGDGMALVFFRDPMAPVQCAVEIARAIRQHPEIRLRMGIHSGPVFRVADINASLNVAGGGINLAQRVMDCGDAGHILVSGAASEVLKERGDWSPYLHDLGEQEVKHGEHVRVFNLCTEDAGNPALPGKMYKAQPTSVLPGILPEPPVVKPAERETKKAPAAVPVKFIGAALLAVALMAAFWYWQHTRPATVPSETASTSNAAAAAPRLLSYSITVRLNPRKSGSKQPKQFAGEIVFSPEDEMRLNLNSPQEGFLYVINEGPRPANGLPVYNLLFPAASAVSDDAPTLSAMQPLYLPGREPPWFRVDAEEGTEKIWLIWSARSVPELEAARKLAKPTDGGEIKDAGQIRQVQEFLGKSWPAAKPVVEKDDNQTNLKGGTNGMLVHLIRLEHK